MTIKTPCDHPLDNSLLTREERLEGQAAYRQGYADAQARATKLAEALRTVQAQLATHMESSAWEDDDGIAYAAAAAETLECDAITDEGRKVLESS